LFPGYSRLYVVVKLRKERQFVGPAFYLQGTPKFLKSFFKSGSPSSMWQSSAEFPKSALNVFLVRVYVTARLCSSLLSLNFVVLSLWIHPERVHQLQRQITSIDFFKRSLKTFLFGQISRSAH